jgi:hypothetical protein
MPVKGCTPATFGNGQEIFSIDIESLTGYPYPELRLFIARRAFISIENIARPLPNAVGVQPLTGIAVRLRAESPPSNSVG